MNGILYLFRTSLKNKLKDLKNHPSRLILYFIFILLIGFVIFTSLIVPADETSELLRDKNELYAILGGLFLFLAYTQYSKGLSSGASFFSMGDVNLLFQSPTSPQTILYYGLARQMSTSLLVGGFILFQASTLKQFFGVGIDGLLIIFMCYTLFMFFGEIMAVFLYSVAGTKERNKRIAQVLQYVLVGFVFLLFGIQFLQTNELLPSLVSALTSPAFLALPLAGWCAGMAVSLINGKILFFLLFLGLNLLLTALFIFLIARQEADYYEDVLQATERNYAVKEAAKEGKVADARPVGKINMKKTGIKRGSGASTLFFKHRLENRRANPFFIDVSTITMLVVSLFFSFAMGEKLQLVMIFGMMAYMQLILSSMGRWVKELSFPYIYMLPQKPFQKLFWAMLESIQGSLLSGILIFTLCGVLLHASIFEILACIVARVSYACLFSAGNVLIQRLFGNVHNKGLILMFYFLTLMMIAVPGIIAWVVLQTITGFLALGLLVVSAWNILAAGIILLCCKDILNNIELNLN